MRKTFIILFVSLVSLCSIQSLCAQTMLVADGKTGEPISYAYVECFSESNQSFAVSCRDGFVSLKKIDFPAVVVVQHMGYSVFRDTLMAPPERIKLVSADYQFEEVIITGQFTPQSVKRSVYNVRSIDREELQTYSARDLSDVFIHQLNFRPHQDVRQGKTSYSLQGISGNNLLILLDGVPINGRTSDDFDFGQIAPEQIERIEIVEGPMAVLYGSNAMAGVINLITRRNYRSGWSLDAQIHEESAGSEYGWSSGTHNQSMQIAHNFKSKPLIAGGGLSRNLFHGYRGDDRKRSMLWKPKEQWIGNVHLQYRPDLWDISLRLDFMDEKIFAPGEPVGTVRPIALDDTYHTQRIFYQFQAGRAIENFGRVETLFALTDYERDKTQKAVNLHTGTSQMSTAEGAQDHTSLFGFQNRTVLNYLWSESYSAQLGYDLEYQKIDGGRLIDGEARSLTELALFLSMEWRLDNRFNIRPGLRYASNSLHRSPLVPSLNLKYDLHRDWDLRAAYSKGYRAPSLREMYFEFFDSNHRIIGNENLIPESGHHYSLHLSNRSLSIDGTIVVLSAELFYNQIKDQITYGRSNQNIQNTTLINQSMFRSKGFRINASYNWRNFHISPSFSLIGRKNVFSSDSEDMGYLFTPEAGLNMRYSGEAGLWSASLNYKFYGEQPVYGIDVEDISQEVQLASVDPFHWMDMSVSRRIGRDFRATLGVRNLLDITDINSTPAVGTIHPAGDVEYISYGRSIFLTINYSLNKF